MNRQYDPIEAQFEREESDGNEARLLAAFEMIFAGIDIPHLPLMDKPVAREEHI